MPVYQRKPRFVAAYSFSLVTGAFHVVSSAGQAASRLITARNDAAEHGHSHR